MSKFQKTDALQFIRKMRGGSQSMLTLASDGCYYVIKSTESPQGPNIPFNEAMGSELFRRLGLQTPEWRLIQVSNHFLDKYPSCWFETEYCKKRPKAGWYFGSRFLALNEPKVFEILPTQYFSRIQRRSDFWLAWTLDVLCEHCDNRQALFVEAPQRWLEAWFIDHGHLFRGPNGDASPVLWASQYLNTEIYTAVDIHDADRIVDALERVDLTAFAKLTADLPAEWKTPTALGALDSFLQRVACHSSLRNTVHALIGLTGSFRRRNERREQAATFESGSGYLHAQIPRLEFAR